MQLSKRFAHHTANESDHERGCCHRATSPQGNAPGRYFVIILADYYFFYIFLFAKVYKMTGSLMQKIGRPQAFFPGDLVVPVGIARVIL